MKKRGVIAGYLPWILIAVAILVILTITIFVLRGKSFSFVDKIKNLIKGGLG